MGYVVKVDDSGRIKLPKNLANADSVIIIDAEAFFIGIPIPKDPLTETSGIIETKLSVKELKEVAEKEAEKDALGTQNDDRE
ncbi:VapB-type antitoxin [Stygiolobus caldivivus]|uniref:VapB-type antitoxin n=1 Tax=Stygiolobus caldivivus TaxID=2824673 RepID=A0A8D5U6W8_9CREN|nr:VapB-type antitoxin [Stygiolobus caldivivus]BCU70088.1 hypothetical protein KN1_13850 [Stygiolobus caldivivus]